jgi:MoaA/NifB/PqqE/SkfB family radical SAM enzyme
MFRFDQLKQIHIEITSRCQAACPMCSRNVHGGVDNPNLKIADWSADEFISIFDQELLEQIKGLYFCGNFGDPIINNQLIEMCQHITDNKPTLELRIHTNGSARNKKWWDKLANTLPNNHVVIFGIDGLEDTHSLYRIGTNFSTILENAKAFINAGGIAEWVFIKFKHNEHQVDTAKELAKQIGFKRFSVKNSTRFLTDNKFEVLDSDSNVLYHLEPPTSNKVTFVDKKLINKIDNWLDEIEINCYVKENFEVYMDANKKLFPCCFIASTPYNYSSPTSIIHPLRTRALQEYNTIMDELGDTDLKKIHVRDIINSPAWQTVWQTYWDSKRLLVCAKTCGKSKENSFSKPSEQIIERENLND